MNRTLLFCGTCHSICGWKPSHSAELPLNAVDFGTCAVAVGAPLLQCLPHTIPYHNVRCLDDGDMIVSARCRPRIKHGSASYLSFPYAMGVLMGVLTGFLMGFLITRVRQQAHGSRNSNKSLRRLVLDRDHGVCSAEGCGRDCLALVSRLTAVTIRQV